MNIKHFITFLLLFFISSAQSQSLHIIDLIKLANISHDQATLYLTTQKDFKVISAIKVYGQAISQYNKTNSKVNETIIKNQWRDTDKVTRAMIHYDVKPKVYADVLIKELNELKFKMISKIDDDHKHVKLYDNGLYTISIYTFNNDKLPASIELHVK